MHPVGLCQRVSSSRVKIITKVQKARWLSVALKVIVGTLVLQKSAKSIFLCESHFNAQWLSTDHQKCYSLFQAFSKWNESNRHVMVNGAKLATERKLREGLIGDLTKTSLGLSLLNYNRASFYVRNNLEQTENGMSCRTRLFKKFSYAFDWKLFLAPTLPMSPCP